MSNSASRQGFTASLRLTCFLLAALLMLATTAHAMSVRVLTAPYLRPNALVPVQLDGFKGRAIVVQCGNTSIELDSCATSELLMVFVAASAESIVVRDPARPESEDPLATMLLPESRVDERSGQRLLLDTSAGAAPTLTCPELQWARVSGSVQNMQLEALLAFHALRLRWSSLSPNEMVVVQHYVELGGTLLLTEGAMPAELGPPDAGSIRRGLGTALLDRADQAQALQVALSASTSVEVDQLAGIGFLGFPAGAAQLGEALPWQTLQSSFARQERGRVTIRALLLLAVLFLLMVVVTLRSNHRALRLVRWASPLLILVAATEIPPKWQENAGYVTASHALVGEDGLGQQRMHIWDGSGPLGRCQIPSEGHLLGVLPSHVVGALTLRRAGGAWWIEEMGHDALAVFRSGPHELRSSEMLARVDEDRVLTGEGKQIGYLSALPGVISEATSDLERHVLINATQHLHAGGRRWTIAREATGKLLLIYAPLVAGR